MPLPADLLEYYKDTNFKLDLDQLIFKPHSDIDSSYEIEIQGYPPSEAATLQTLKYRQSEAPHLFYGCFLPYKNQEYLIGFITATQSKSTKLTHESMSLHQPSGQLICMHSIVIHPSFRNRKVASAFLSSFLSYLKEIKNKPELGDGNKVAIIAHLYLVEWYKKMGFKYLGESEVVHGPDAWYDLEFYL